MKVKIRDNSGQDIEEILKYEYIGLFCNGVKYTLIEVDDDAYMWVSDIRVICQTAISKEKALRLADDDPMFVFNKLSDFLDWRNDLSDYDMRLYGNKVRKIKENNSDYSSYRLE